VLPLVDGRQQRWPAWSWACLAAGPVLLVVFAAYLRRVRRGGGQPLLDPGIFAVPAFRADLTVQALFWCQQAASYLLLALFLQQGRGMSPLASGGVFAVLAAGYLATSFGAPGLTVRFGRRVIATGALVGAVGDLLVLLTVVHWGVGGPPGALYPGDFFELERSEITAFIPVEPQPSGLGPLGSQIRLLEIPAVEAAVAVHEGDLGDSDRTYGAIGSVVAERAIGVDGPIREYYVVGPGEGGDESRRRTEICWPVFLTQ
jgi:effector-binding domain-containing protein